NNDYIWARGFRNPFTMTIQPSTGALWLEVAGASYEQIFVVGRGAHGGWPVENDPAPGQLAPIVKYHTNIVDTFTISSATRAGGVVSYTVARNHLLRRGEKVTVSKMSPPSFNGSFYVASLPSATTFTVAQAGQDQSGSGGQLSTTYLGGCVTGGAFYTGT